MFAPRQPDFPPQTVINGFPFYDGSDGSGPDPQILRFLDAGEPPLVFTLGSSAVWNAEDFYDVAVAAARRIGARALLLAGRDAPGIARRVGADGRQIAIVDYAPHSLVMPRATAVVHQGGVGIESISLPFSGHILELRGWGLLFTVFWLVGITNLLNLIDGVDGLAGGIALMLMGLPVYVGCVSGTFALLAAGVTGSLLAFLWFNCFRRREFISATAAPCCSRSRAGRCSSSRWSSRCWLSPSSFRSSSTPASRTG